MADDMTTDETVEPRASRGLAFLLMIGLVLLGIAGFIVLQRVGERGVNIAYDEPRPISVSTQTIETASAFQIKEQFTGLVSARRSSALGFETGGLVTVISGDVGDVKAKGDVLARLDTRTLRANLAAANAQAEEAEASLKLAETTVNRQKVLQERGLLSTQRFDEADAQSAAATARLNAARAQRQALIVQIEKSELRAPYDGVITRRFMDEGTIAAPGTPVFQLVERAVLETSIGLPPSLAERLSEGESYALIIGEREYQAVLRSLTGVIEAGQRTITAVFDFGEENTGIFPGTVARLEVEQAVDQSGFWIPISALSEADRGLWSVFAVIENDGSQIVEKRLVDLLHSEANRAFVRGAFEEGEMFVTDGLHRLTEGMKVAPIASQTAR